jgi:acetate---CoA ligase (ADP-forming)
LAMILVKAEDIPDVAEECGRKGIKRMVISTAGFSEYHPEKKALEERLMELCHQYEMRFIGPNCMAIANMENGLFLPFVTHRPSNWRKGPVSIISQSGNMAERFSTHLSFEKIGVCKFASVGNKLNVDEVDLLEYFLQDPQTEIVVLYLEGLSRADKFFKLASNCPKPIVAVKSNISLAGHEIARSHTKALASNDTIVDAAFKQAGIIRVDSLWEMLTCVKMLLLPPPNGNRVASLSSSGGTSVMVADECERKGFIMPPLSKDFYQWIENRGRAKIIHYTNPVDLGDTYDLATHYLGLEKLQELHEVDAIFYSMSYSAIVEEIFPSHMLEKLFAYCGRVNRHAKIPVILHADTEDMEGLVRLKKRMTVPLFESIPGAFKALRKVMDAQRAKTASHT